MKAKNQEWSQVMSLAVKTDETVLITGPTGSGKSKLAKEIHDQSAYQRGPFVLVNLATLHAGTIEAELFGYQKGAFTGAQSSQMGKLEAAQGGTVFLDEIGELSLALQVKLLEFLQSKVLFRLGSHEERKVNVRIIAATNRRLKKEVELGKFREDLFHRLRILEIELPPLSSRGEEFGEIVLHLLEELAQKHSKKLFGLEVAVARALESYSWPGNIRELQNVLRYAVLVSTGSKLKFEDLPPWFLSQETMNGGVVDESRNELGMVEVPMGLDYYETLSRFEKIYLSKAFERYRGRINHTARQLGMSKTTLMRRLRAYGLIQKGNWV